MGVGSEILSAGLHETIKRIVKQPGGAIFYDRIRSAAGGTGTARATISSTYEIPDLAAELVAIAPGLAPAAPAAAESSLAVMDIIGRNFSHQPIELFAPVGASKLGTIDEVTPTPQIWWETRIPVKPGGTYDWGIEPLDAMAANSRAFVDLMFATKPSGLPIINSVATRETALGTAAGDVSGGTLTLEDAKELVEVDSVATTATVTADEELVADMTVRSDSLRPLQQFRVGVATNYAIEATTGVNAITEISRNPTPGMMFSIVNPTVAFTINIDTLITGNGQFANLLRYLKASGAS